MTLLELSLHILDVAENGLAAGASRIGIGVTVLRATDRLVLTVTDNGSGIRPEDLAKVTDPFYTTRTTRSVGLGLPFLKMAAEQAGGAYAMGSEWGKGTWIRAEFQLSHLDRVPMGDLAGTLLSLIVGRPEVDFVYQQNVDGEEFVLDTREVKEVLDGVSLSDPEVIGFLRDSLLEGLADLGPI